MHNQRTETEKKEYRLHYKGQRRRVEESANPQRDGRKQGQKQHDEHLGGEYGEHYDNQKTGWRFVNKPSVKQQLFRSTIMDFLLLLSQSPVPLKTYPAYGETKKSISIRNDTTLLSKV
jgi:hypothetical protein